jgi:aminoglycoside phosphotransferase (APT) family kinase protein
MGRDRGTDQPEWAAEHVVDAQRAGELLAAQFPFLRGASVEPLAEGWDNTVHLVGGRWAFRFPRRAIALPGVRREIGLLPQLAGRLPLPVPVPELVGAPIADYPWPFWGARLLPGRELAEAGLPDGRRVRMGAAVGAFLKALHDPRHVAEIGSHLVLDPWRRGDPSIRIPLARERLERLERRGLWAADDAVTTLLAEASGLSLSRAEPVVAHGDLHVRHLLVDGSGGVTGVIDWGDLCLADAAVDLSMAYAAFSGKARAMLFAGYGPIDTERETRARVLAVYLSAVLADYAATQGHEALREEALAGLRRAAGA